MTDRNRLPERRQGEAVVFEHDGVSFRAAFNRFPDDTIGELFIDAGLVGSSAYTMAKECAILFSLACQYNVPIETIRQSLPQLSNGSPAGPIGKALKLAEAVTA